ncbi:MAG TPA: FecR domain-containing protein [Puia sp.]|jgi:ferric-dicitrate binding protein FerR (iron transport regulator)
MPANYTEPEDLLSDESFLSWYFKTGKPGEDTWESWMSGHPDREQLVQQAITLLQATRQPEKPIPAHQLAAAESALFKKIDALPVVPLYRDRRMMVAAAVFAILVVGLILVKFPSSRPERKTAYGQISHEKLPDGTVVMMNANSHLSYTPDWKDGKDREVWMDGEAFFCVQKTPSKSRFIVHTVHFDIIVTGTQFNVVNRHGIENVLLEEGSVTLRTPDGKEVNMKPGDFVAFRDARLEKKPVQHDSLVAWKEQKLVFDKTPLRQLVQIINDQYGVNMRLADESIGDSTISAILPDNNLDVFIKALEGTSEFDVTKEGDHMTIRAHSR